MLDSNRLKKLLKEAEEFARGEYTTALMKGDQLSAEEHEHVVKELVRFTGLSADFIERTNLRIIDQHYFKELLRDRGQTVGTARQPSLGLDRFGVTDMPD